MGRVAKRRVYIAVIGDPFTKWTRGKNIFIYIYIYIFFFEEKGIKFSVTSHAIVTKLYVFSFVILDFFENRNYRSFKTIKEKKERKVRDSLTLKRTNRDNPKQYYVSARLQCFTYIYIYIYHIYIIFICFMKV